MVDKICFASLYVPTSGNRGAYLTRLERLVPKFASISARYKIGEERAQGEEARPVPPLRRNLQPARATRGEDLPSEYVFALRACYEAECNHPICQRGRPPDELVWYTGGPSVQFLPLPVPDPKRPWGSKE